MDINKQIHDIDVWFETAAKNIVLTQNATYSLIMRKTGLSYEAVQPIMDQLEAAGIVGPLPEEEGLEGLPLPRREVLVKSIDELDWLISKCLTSYIWTPTEEKYKK